VPSRPRHKGARTVAKRGISEVVSRFFLSACQWAIFGRERSRRGPAVQRRRSGRDRGSQRRNGRPAHRLHTAVQALQRVMNGLEDGHATAEELVDALR
jgi:hypothetical protein